MSFAKQAVSCLLCACVRLCIVLNTHRCRLLISNESSGNLLCGVGTACKLIFSNLQYVPLGPAIKGKSTGKPESAPFKPPHSGSSGPLGKPYEYIPCPALKQVRCILDPTVAKSQHVGQRSVHDTVFCEATRPFVRSEGNVQACSS